MEKIFNNDFVKHDNYKRYDYITRSLILLISKEFNNEKYKWIKYDTFKYYLKMVLNENNIPDNIDNYIKLIEIESENYKNSDDIDNNPFIGIIELNNVKDNNRYCGIESSDNNKIGLLNLGNNCYLNSLLQALFNFNNFRDYILKVECNDESNNCLNELIIIFDALKTNKKNKILFTYIIY